MPVSLKVYSSIEPPGVSVKLKEAHRATLLSGVILQWA